MTICGQEGKEGRKEKKRKKKDLEEIYLVLKVIFSGRKFRC